MVFYKNNRVYILLMAVLGLLIFFYYIKLLTPIESFIFRILNPIHSEFNSVSLGLNNLYEDNIISKEKLLLDNEILKKELEKLLIENSRMKILAQENKELKKIINFFSKDNFDYVTGKIIYKNNLFNNYYNDKFIVIDLGFEDGVKENLVVVNSEGSVIGKIIETKKNVSKACLIVNSNCKIAASIQNKDNTSGIIEGDLGLVTKMKFIPQGEDLNIEDTIVSSGLEENVPYGLPIGKIKDIKKDDNDIWQEAIVEIFANINNVQLVSVLK